MIRSGTDRGASSVIGVLLLAAVAVVVGATLSVFAIQFGGSVTETAPVADIQIESQYFGDGVPKNDAVVLTHVGGDRLEREHLEIRVGDDVVYNRTADSESNSGTNNVGGLLVEVDDDDFNDLNKPSRLSPPRTHGGPPGDSDGSDPSVVLEWESEVQAGQQLVIQERNASRAYDVMSAGETMSVIWRDGETTAVIATATVGPEAA